MRHSGFEKSNIFARPRLDCLRRWCRFSDHLLCLCQELSNQTGTYITVKFKLTVCRAFGTKGYLFQTEKTWGCLHIQIFAISVVKSSSRTFLHRNWSDKLPHQYMDYLAVTPRKPRFLRCLSAAISGRFLQILNGLSKSFKTISILTKWRQK